MYGSLNAKDYIAIRVSYALKNFTLNYEVFTKMLRTHGFESFIPQKRPMSKIFETVTKRLEGNFKTAEAKYKSVLIDVSESKSPIIERVLLAATVANQRQKVSDGDKVARLFYNRETGEYKALFHDSTEWGMTDAISDLKPCPVFLRDAINNIPYDMGEEAKLASSSQIRGVFSKIISSSGIPVEEIKSTWTIPKAEEETAKDMKALSKEINEIAGEKVIRVDFLPIVDSADIREDLKEDAVAYATREFQDLATKFEELVLKEQAIIDDSEDPESARAKAMIKWNSEAEKILGVISAHEETLGEAIKDILELKNSFKKNLETFEIKTPA